MFDSLAIYTVTALCSAWALYRMFKAADEVVADDKREAFGTWLTKPRWDPSGAFDAFKQLFEAVFTKKHLSARCAWMSVLCSLVVTLATGAIYYSINLAKVADFDIMAQFLIKDTWWFLLIFTIIPDYISLFQSRTILRILAKTEGLFKSALLVLIDAGLTLLIVTIVVSSATFLLPESIERQYNTSFLNGWNVLSLETLPDGKILFPFILFTVSALFTSIWLWLFLLSSVLSRITNLAWRAGAMPKRYLKLKQSPFQSVGFICALVVVLLYIISGIGSLSLIP